MSITLAIGGAKGRMGQAVRRLADGFEVKVLIEAVADGTCVDRLTERVDVLIDFSTPEATARRAAECAALGTAMVVGTTGLGPAQREALEAASRRVAVLVAANMSVGVQAVLAILPELRRRLAGFDVDLVETHHAQKVDAPSGTALAMGEALGGGAKIHSIRAGSEPGEHRIIFGGQGESVTLTHRAFSRDIFALGALRAARFVASARPGLYTMADALKA
jgi:4-hydroxy-tetrahydrodipicolinate reductase